MKFLALKYFILSHTFFAWFNSGYPLIPKQGWKHHSNLRFLVYSRKWTWLSKTIFKFPLSAKSTAMAKCNTFSYNSVKNFSWVDVSVFLFIISLRTFHELMSVSFYLPLNLFNAVAKNLGFLDISGDWIVF